MKRIIILRVASVILATGTVIILWWVITPIINGGDIYSTVVKIGGIVIGLLYTTTAISFTWRAFNL